MHIAVTHSALDDLASIKEYYQDEGVPNIGDNFVSAIIQHIQTLEEHPDIGRIVPEYDTENLRELIHPPFRIVYLREASTIHVIRIWRSERLLVLPDDET